MCCYIVLLHYPVYNKQMQIISTSVTNLDIHDISRIARTYDMKGFFIVHPHPEQQRLVRDIIGYWTEGFGGQYNPDRQEALKLLRLMPSMDEVVDFVTETHGKKPKCIATDARTYPKTIGYADMKKLFRQSEDETVYLLLLGTGWGIEEKFIENCDYILEPIEPDRIYNHLSVRSAAAIITDRLFGGL
ncbi:MAG: RNA methyltransferase [Syntrophomonadaceae bacterium]|nr:RNA methyltransferase [Syntrophomonadaceae bacterium]